MTIDNQTPPIYIHIFLINMSQPVFSRAPLHMRYSRESYFEPKFVSIGPLYYGKQKEQKVIEKAKEECISYYVSKLPTSTSNLNINDLVKQINVAEMKDQIHGWYGKSIVLPEDDNLFQMLVTDSCFIIRIILAFSREEESLFSPGVDIKTVRFDLLLMENQIPFFILKKVYKFLRDPKMLSPVPDSENSPSISNSQGHKATSCVCCVFQSSPQGHTTRMCCLPISFNKNNILDPEQGHLTQSTLSVEHSQSQTQTQSRRHLLQSTTQQSQSHSPHESSPEQTTNLDEFLKELKPFIWCNMPWQFNKDAKFTEEPKHLLDLYWKWCIPSPSNSQVINATNQIHDVGVHETWVETHLRRSNAPRRIKSAFVLERSAGVNFHKKEHKDGFSVTFRNGILKIPHLQLDPNHATLLANLVAFEEFKPSKKRFLTSYVLLLDGLISTRKDVELLEQHGVITNKLSSTQKASAYFNDIGNVCSVDYEDHYCKNQFDALNSYYHSNWKRQLAKLRHKYFNSPWAFISFFAGVLLLSLSAIQTGYSIARYYQHR
ncbi:hypothetical protein FCM35_KLT16360 [Carex littledalei]|uniref:Uncharacterized protein n=1 Tax=Carex littledalei TaxID=544730 RepID=A0A833RCJ9_9POAL|nr:hypothetical protein FCM35_KLT16360 [Carex littledalei]